MSLPRDKLFLCDNELSLPRDKLFLCDNELSLSANKPCKASLTLLILAAGMSSRYGKSKQIDVMGPNGETIVDYSIHYAIKARFTKVVFVIQKQWVDTFRKIFDAKLANKIQVVYVFQECDRSKPYGTGHAVLSAKHAINEPFCVINADDFYGYDSFVKMSEFLRSDNNDCALMGYRLDKTLSEHGTVSRGVCTIENGYLTKITECNQIRKQGTEIVYGDTVLDKDTIVSMNFWGFRPFVFDMIEKYFNDWIPEISNEFYITTAVDCMLETIKFLVIPTNTQWFGVTYPADKNLVVQELKNISID